MVNIGRVTARTRAVIEKLRFGYELRVQTTEKGMNYHLIRRGCKSVVVHHLTVKALFFHGLIKFNRRTDGKGGATNRFYILLEVYK